jgi:hypothetical protein
MSRGPIRHMEELRRLPREGAFVFRDHFDAIPGGLVRYLKERGLIQKTGDLRQNGSARCGIWELTERARRILA